MKVLEGHEEKIFFMFFMLITIFMFVFLSNTWN